MPAIFLNESELMAIRGLQHAAICLYMAIRQTMDLATGMCGIRSMISWQAFRESLYVEPAPGRTDSGSLHESKLRRLAEQLEKAGLIKNCSNSSNRQLIFKCLLATHDKSVQNKPDRQPDRPQGNVLSFKSRDYNERFQEPDRQPDTHPSLDIYIPILSSSSHKGETDDDDINSNSETQNPQPEKPLIFPPRTEDWHQRIQTMLRNINQADSQMLLDELAGHMRTGKVSKPLGYLARMIENYLKGDFRGELAAGEARIREQRQKELEKRLQERNKPEPVRNSEVALAAIQKIKLLKQGVKS